MIYCRLDDWRYRVLSAKGFRRLWTILDSPHRPGWAGWGDSHWGCWRADVLIGPDDMPRIWMFHEVSIKEGILHDGKSYEEDELGIPPFYGTTIGHTSILFFACHRTIWHPGTTTWGEAEDWNVCITLFGLSFSDMRWCEMMWVSHPKALHRFHLPHGLETLFLTKLGSCALQEAICSGHDANFLPTECSNG